MLQVVVFYMHGVSSSVELLCHHAYVSGLQMPQGEPSDLDAAELASVRLFQINTPSVVNISNIRAAPPTAPPGPPSLRALPHPSPWSSTSTAQDGRMCNPSVVIRATQHVGGRVAQGRCGPGRGGMEPWTSSRCPSALAAASSGTIRDTWCALPAERFAVCGDVPALHRC